MITSKDNPKLKLVRRLGERGDRRREGLFLSEGEDLLQAGLAAGWTPSFVLVAATEQGEGAAVPASGVEALRVEARLLDAVSSLGSGSRMIAVWPLPEAAAWPADPGGPTTYLHGVADPGNVGTIIRSVDALRGGSVALGPGAADPYGPKAVRASMGSIFTVEVRCEVAFATTPAPRVALVAHGGEPLAALVGATTLVLGAERGGIPPSLLALSDRRVTIGLRERGAESLNVAAAAAIALQRLSSPGR